jgi:general secretion pathway protein H
MAILSRRSARRDGGFTLLELLVVLTLAVTLTSAAAFTIRDRAPSLDQTADLIAREMQRARIDALQRGSDQTVLFDLEAGRMTRGSQTVVTWAPPINVKLESAQSVFLEHGLPGMVFFAQGGATGGIIELQSASQSRRLELRWLTGAVRDG